MGLVGGKRVAGLGDLGEWVSGGRLTAGGGEVAGRASPAPTGGGKGGRVLGGNGQAEGSRPLPTVWGETGWQSSNGWLWKVHGPGMPGPYGGVVGTVCFPHSAHTNVENTCNFYLIIIV